MFLGRDSCAVGVFCVPAYLPRLGVAGYRTRCVCGGFWEGERGREKGREGERKGGREGGRKGGGVGLGAQEAGMAKGKKGKKGKKKAVEPELEPAEDDVRCSNRPSASHASLVLPRPIRVYHSRSSGLPMQHGRV